MVKDQEANQEIKIQSLGSSMIFRSNPFPIIITIQIVQIKTTLSKDHYFKGNINLRALLTDKFNKQVIQIGSKILRKDHLINKILSTNRP